MLIMIHGAMKNAPTPRPLSAPLSGVVIPDMLNMWRIMPATTSMASADRIMAPAPCPPAGRPSGPVRTPDTAVHGRDRAIYQIAPNTHAAKAAATALTSSIAAPVMRPRDAITAP